MFFLISLGTFSIKRPSLLGAEVHGKFFSPQPEDILALGDGFIDGVDDDVDQVHRQMLERRWGLKIKVFGGHEN